MAGPRPRRIPLNALRTFEAAARFQSFKNAAEELCVSPTTVSNQIRKLERDWNCRLFTRKTRQVILTDTGRSLARVVSTAFDDIRAEIENQIDSVSSRVSLSVGPIFGSRWLAKRLRDFRRDNPGIQLSIFHGPRISGALDLATPLAVDWGHGDWIGLDSIYLFDINYTPVLSPDLISECGRPESPEDLLRMPMIHQIDRTEWNAWFATAGIQKAKYKIETTIADSNLVLQAALNGQGVALGTLPFVQDEIDCGNLVMPFDNKSKPGRSYYLVSRPGLLKIPEIRTVHTWLLRQAEQYRNRN